MSRILLIFSAIFGLAAGGLGYINKQRADETAQQRAEALQKAQQLEAELQDRRAEAEEAKKKAEEAEAAREQISKSLQATKAEARQIADELNGVKQEMANKEQQIADLRKELELRISATTGGGDSDGAGLDVSNQEIEDLKAANAELEQLKQSLTARLEQAESRAKALADAEAARQAGLARKSLEGQVLAFNAAWNFAVISIGDRQGVVPNAELLVRRGGEMIGKIRITSVEQSQSIGDVLLDTVRPGVQIQAGDVVIFPGGGT
ncbi:MAG: hypothetical protein SNJ52_05030 [Verrucomicrobiia bacterium]